jgi:outer membrane cobalamin receptor
MKEYPLSSQIDLFIAGTIQESATIYFVFENLLDEQYYIIPYYPMYPMGLRFGISWEFLD